MENKSTATRFLRYDVVLPILIFIFIGILVVMSTGYAWRSAQLPMLIGGITIGFLLVELYLRLFMKRKKVTEKKSDIDIKIEKMKEDLDVTSEEEDPGVAKRRLIYALISIIFFLVSFHILGYIITAFILSFVLVRLLGFRKYITNLVFSALFVAGMYMIFGYFLGVSLPWGIILERFFD